MSGKHSRDKGLNFERLIAREFRELGWEEAKRHLEVQGYLDELGIDLDNTYPFKIQCKRNKGYAPVNKIEEVNIENGYYSMLITKADGKPAVACMYWDDMKELLQILKKEEII